MTINPAYADWLDETEAKIIDAIIDHVLAQSILIDVRDAYGDIDEPIEASSDADAIRREVAATGETLFDFHRPGEAAAFGWVLLIHGNGADVISDCAGNDAIEALLKPANDIAEKLNG